MDGPLILAWHERDYKTLWVWVAETTTALTIEQSQDFPILLLLCPLFVLGISSLPQVDGN